MQTIKDARNRLEQRKGQRTQLLSSIDSLQQQIVVLERDLHRHEQAREIIRTVGLATQKQLSVNIADISSLALSAVFDNPYQLNVEFVQRRDKTECDLTFARDDILGLDPMTESGGGTVDVAAFALRVASWSMQSPHSRSTLVLDEPFLHVKGDDANLRVLRLLHTISSRLGLQIITVADERIDREDLIENSDRTFEVTKRNGVATVTQI